MIKTYVLLKMLQNDIEPERTVTIKLEIFETIFDKISEEIVIIDTDYQIILVNSEFCKNYNTTKGEAIGGYCYKIIHGLDEPCSFESNICPLVQILKTKKSNRSLHKHSIKGKKALMEQFTTPIIFKNGEIQSVCKISKKLREYETGDINILDSNVKFKQKMSEFCNDIQSYAELSIYFLKKHRNEGDIEILLREILKITKYGKELLSLIN